MVAAAVALAFASLTSCVQKRANAQVADLIDIESVATRSANYKTEEAGYGVIERESTTSAGFVFPISEGIYNLKDEARIKDIYVKNGTDVKKGDPLLLLEYDMVSLGSQEEQMRIYIENHEKSSGENRDRMLKMISEAQGAPYEGDPVDMEIRRIELMKMQADYDYYVYVAERESARLAKELDEILEKAAGNLITAPYDGMVDRLNYYTPGRIVPAGARICEIFYTDFYLFRITGDVQSFRYNMPVVVQIDKDTFVDGVIVSDPVPAFPKESQGTFYVRIFESHPVTTLRNRRISVAGMAYQITSTLTIPNNGVRNEDGKKYVFLVENGTVKKRYVQTGINDRDNTQILAGLSPGDMVMIN